MDYKIVLCGKSIYKEIELKENTDTFKIGTHKGCRIRFAKELFSVDFELTLQFVDDKWQILCSELVCIQAKNGAIGYGCIPQPGNQVMILDDESHVELFRIDFFRDFPLKNKDYDLTIDFSDREAFTIGGNLSDVLLDSEDIGGDYLIVHQEQDSILLDCTHCKIGIFVNGLPTSREQIRLRNKDFFAVKGYQFYIYEKTLYTTADGSVTTNMKVAPVVYEKNHFNYPKFIRNVRQQYVLPDEEIEVLDPKSAPEKPEQNFIASLAPTLISMGLMVMLRSMMGRGGIFIVYSVVMMLTGVVSSIISFRMSGKDYREDMKRREEVYRKYVAKQEEKIQDLRNKEFSLSCEKSPSIEKDISMVADFDARLFEKEKEHEDYLEVRIGSGVVKSNCPVSYKKQEYVDTDDIFMEYPKAISEKYDYISNMPVTISLKEPNAVGFVGNRSALYEMAKNIIINLSVEHFYQDVKLFFVLNEDDVDSFSWARWLQNTYMGDCTIRNFMFDSESDKISLEYLYSQLSERENLSEEDLQSLPDMIVFVYRSERIANHPIMQYVEKARSLHFTFLFFEDYEEMLNFNCEKKVYLDSDNHTGIIQNAEDGEKVQNFVYEVISQKLVEMAAIKLACVYVDEVSLESSLTKNITLYELLHIQNADELDFGARWERSKIYESMAAPLGVKSGGDVVCLDIHEKFHGPHGLVAGTTGSGKSEILQSYILSMATLFHPYEVGFVIIDFKGGGMANQFKNLPHMMGSITNIDGNEIDRSLKSIRAELLKRQELFAEYEVNHIDDYIKLTKQGKTKQPLPHLILIVDEFAELKAEQPEFMKELISTARIGRSLGVHLILATQKPAGVVNDQIWSNSKFKLCLKVQDKSDSNEVLKSPLAAEIREPGRAYLQVGNNEIFQLFQSAYSGAVTEIIGAQKSREFQINRILLSGKREQIFEQKREKVDASAETQMEALVNQISEYCKENDIKKLSNVYLPSLERYITYDVSANELVRKHKNVVCPLGIYDNPMKQSQGIKLVDFSVDNTVIIGSAQNGKTNVLQTMVRGLAANYTPAEVNIYILDFASRIMKNFEKLKHVVGIVTASEDDKLKNTFKLLREEIDKRKEFLSAKGLSSYSTYLDAGFHELPQIVVLVDNYTNLKNLYPDLEDSFLSLCREGISMGVSVVVANQQSQGMGFKLMNTFSQKICLPCNDKNEYTSFLGLHRVTVPDIQGRCYTNIGRDMYECQVYLAFEGEREIDRVAGIREFIVEINEKYKDYKGFYIPEIPSVVTDAVMEEQFPEEKRPERCLLAGLDFANTKPMWFSYVENIGLMMLGRAHSGRRNYIAYMLQSFEKYKETEPVEVYFHDNYFRKFEPYKQYEVMKSYTCVDSEMETAMTEIMSKLAERQQLLIENKLDEIDKLPYIIMILNSTEYYASVQTNRAMMENFKSIFNKYKSLRICVILSNVEMSQAPIGMPDLLKLVRDARQQMIFGNLAEQKFVEATPGLQRKFPKKLLPGECYYVEHNTIHKIRTPKKTEV